MFPDLEKFIFAKILKRQNSFFAEDIANNTNKLFSEIQGKKILVIGGGGTIGSNFIKALLPFKPGSVIVVDTSENSLTELVRDIRSTYGLQVPREFITYPVSFGDETFIKIYNNYKPFDIIANFAAHKHVRSEKDIFSIEAMLKNNVTNAYHLISMIKSDRPSRFFCVSTDKAANPVNVMGASKKLMENMILSFSDDLHCTTARFANVAFSNGSLLDGFIKRMLNRQPLSVPKDIARYFVSPTEAGEICMLACVLGKSGQIFFPKFSESQLTHFYDIAKEFLSSSGYTVVEYNNEEKAKAAISKDWNGNDIAYPVYTFLSDTSGEKLYEEFFEKDENVDLKSFESLGVITPGFKPDPEQFSQLHGRLEQFFKNSSFKKSDLIELLTEFVPGFEHKETGKSLDAKM